MDLTVNQSTFASVEWRRAGLPSGLHRPRCLRLVTDGSGGPEDGARALLTGLPWALQSPGVCAADELEPYWNSEGPTTTPAARGCVPFSFQDERSSHS